MKIKYGHTFEHRAELHAWQEQRVQALLKRVLQVSPFYQEYFSGKDLAEWRNWPMINKQIMMENFTAFNTVGITKEAAFAVASAAEDSRDFTPTLRGITVGLSSGTSGNRGLFLASKAEQAKWAGAILAKALPRSLFRAQRIAFFLRANSNLYKTLGKRRIQFQFFDLFTPIEEHIARLNEFQPTVLAGPPSLLRLLADALSLDLQITPEKVISVAEVLDPLDQRYLEYKFKMRIHQVYQCTEGFLGTTCSFGTLHLNEDLVVFQKDYLDDAHKRFSPIITDFSRITQPIIRYRLDDILTERTERCPCGSLFMGLEYIEGRCDDIFYVPARGQRRLIPVFPDFIRRAIITADESILEYTAVQKDEIHIEIGLRCPHSHMARECVRRNLDKLWETMDTAIPAVAFVEIPKLLPGRKLKRVERMFKVVWEK